jgi:HEPN domain-containing protein
MNQSNRDYIRQWLNKADEDLLVVQKLTESNIVAPSSACFHCQQAVEKSLKAFLIAHKRDIRKTHNIEFLLSECKDIDEEFRQIDPKDLNEFSVEIRYPGDSYNPSNDEVLKYKEIAYNIKQLVEEKLRGLLNH